MMKIENDIGNKKNIALVVIALLFYSWNIVDGVERLAIVWQYDIPWFLIVPPFVQALLWSVILSSWHTTKRLSELSMALKSHYQAQLDDLSKVVNGTVSELTAALGQACIIIDEYANNGPQVMASRYFDDFARSKRSDMMKLLNKEYSDEATEKD